MSTIKDCIPLFHSLSVTEQRYNALYVDNRCCFLQLINRIIFLICGLRGCCLRDAAQRAIPIQEEHQAMKNYSLAKEALCANKAESIDLFVSAYFARRAQLPSSLDPSLLSQALAQDLLAAGVQAETISEIQAKIESKSTAPSLPAPPNTEPVSDEPTRLAAELMTRFVQADRKVEAMSGFINEYLQALHKHLQPEDSCSYYLHINHDLFNAYRKHLLSDDEALTICRADYFNLKLSLVEKLHLDETMDEDLLFLSLFSADVDDMAWTVTLTTLCGTNTPFRRFCSNVEHVLKHVGRGYHLIIQRLHPTNAPTTTEQARHFAYLALNRLLVLTCKAEIGSYQEWLKTGTLPCSSQRVNEKWIEDVKAIAQILPLFQRPLSSLSKEERESCEAVMHKILSVFSVSYLTESYVYN